MDVIFISIDHCWFSVCWWAFNRIMSLDVLSDLDLDLDIDKCLQNYPELEVRSMGLK